MQSWTRVSHGGDITDMEQVCESEEADTQRLFKEEYDNLENILSYRNLDDLGLSCLYSKYAISLA